MLCIASASAKISSVIASWSCFDQDMVLVVSTLWKNKPNKSRKSLHGSQRGLGFHLELNFQCKQMANMINMMFFHYMSFNSNSFLLNRKVIFCQGKYMYKPSGILSQEKKTISLHYFCTTQNSMETQIYFDWVNLDITHDWELFPAVFWVWIFQRLDTNTEAEIYAMQFFQGYNSLLAFGHPINFSPKVLLSS